MGGFLSFLFLLAVIWLVLHCVSAFLRLLGEGLFWPRQEGIGARRIRSRVSRPCPNPLCLEDNRGDARFCARCGHPLNSRAERAVDRAC